MDHKLLNMDFTGLSGQELQEAVDQYIHGGHRKAIQKAKKVAYKNNDELVPPRAIIQRKAKSPGKYVMVDPDQDMEDLMSHKGPRTKYGHQVFQAGYVEYPADGSYEVHPHVARFIGDPQVQAMFVSLYGNQPITITNKPEKKVTAAQNAAAIARKQVGLRKTKPQVVKEWMAINKDYLDAEVCLLTLQQLKMINLDESMEAPKYQSEVNFKAGEVSNPMMHSPHLLHE